MPDETPALAVPYPLPGDAVVDYPALGRLLAERVDALAAPLWSYRNSPAVVTANSFGASGSMLAQDIGFDADGATTYLLQFMSPGWMNGSLLSNSLVEGSLDGVALGILAYMTCVTANAYTACRGDIIFTPPAGRHYANARPWVGGGQATILGGPGGPGAQAPMLLTLEPIRPLGTLLKNRDADDVIPPADVDLGL